MLPSRWADGGVFQGLRYIGCSMAQWKWDEERRAWRKDLWLEGRRTKLTFRGTKKEAEEYEARKRLELAGRGGIVRNRDVQTFFEFSTEVYKPHAKSQLRKSTWSVRKHQLAHLIEFFGPYKLTKLTTALVESYKQQRSEKVEPTTVDNELRVFNTVLAYARHLELPCATPKVKRPKGKRKKGKIQFYSREEVARIQAVTPAVLFPLVAFLFETGCRKSEAIALKWSNVDLKNGMLKIWSTVDEDDDYEVKSVEREIPISDRLLRILKEQKLRGLSDTWVFPNQLGGRFAEFPKHPWYKIMKAAGTKGGPHKCRHTFASFFLEAKPDMVLLGNILGHTTEKVTAIYAHLVPTHLAAARNVVTFGGGSGGGLVGETGNCNPNGTKLIEESR